MRPFVVAAVLGFYSAIPAAAQTDITPRDLRSLLSVLTADSLEGRSTGSAGQRRAADFIAARFKTLGLLPAAADGYFEKFGVTQTYWKDVYVVAGKKKLINFRDIIFKGPDAENEEVEKEVVFGGHGTDAELAQIDVKNKIVFVFVDNLHGYYDVSIALQRRQAYGLIVANPSNEKQFNVLKLTMKDHLLSKRTSLAAVTRPKTPLDTLRSINAFLIPNEQIKTVMGASVKQLQKSIDAHDLKSIASVRIKIKAEKTVAQLESKNVIGVLKGKSEETIVLSAHYDHLGRSDAGLFAGADDNGSGTAALLEIAEAFASNKELPYTLMFFAASAEEDGLLGSEYHTGRIDFDADRIMCNLNIDMIGRRDTEHERGDYVYCLGSGQSPVLDSALREAAKQSGITLDFSLDGNLKGNSLYRRSDQFNFFRKGVPAYFFFGGFHADYHLSTDTIDKIDFQLLSKRTKLIKAMIQLIH